MQELISIEEATFHTSLICCIAATCCEGCEGERGDAYMSFILKI